MSIGVLHLCLVYACLVCIWSGCDPSRLHEGFRSAICCRDAGRVILHGNAVRGSMCARPRWGSRTVLHLCVATFGVHYGERFSFTGAAIILCAFASAQLIWGLHGEDCMRPLDKQPSQLKLKFEGSKQAPVTSCPALQLLQIPCR